jgi:NADH dehydrogenase
LILKVENKLKIQNIPQTDKKRIVVAGGGFAGLEFVANLCTKPFQLVFIDRNNYHQFQPLLYQVATAGLEPGSVSFPLRKLFQKYRNVHFRMAEVLEIHTSDNEIVTNIGSLHYDYLVIATGATSNFFGLKNIEKNSLPMKSVTDAIYIRNVILQNLERALNETDPEKISSFLNIGIVGGGPTGVELAGALAEMKKYVLRKDYPGLDLNLMQIKVFEGSHALLSGMSASSSDSSRKYLEKLGVEIKLKSRVLEYDGEQCILQDGEHFPTRTLIWAAGVAATTPEGIPNEAIGRGFRVKVDRQNRVPGFNNVFVLGDACIMETPNYPGGHPQVAQVAIQQARHLAKNLQRIAKNIIPMPEFEYKNKGSMATVGRNLAVADLPWFHMGGFLAWLLWSLIHLMTIVGAKNKLLVFINWSWRYFTYDQSLRLLIRHKAARN